jgi:hypothetical protein
MKDEGFSVTLKCKTEDLRHLGAYVTKYTNVPIEDLTNENFGGQQRDDVPSRLRV